MDKKEPKPGSWEWWRQNRDSPIEKPPDPVEKLPAVRKFKKWIDKEDGYVYYIGDGNGRIKIGWSKNPWSRFTENKTWLPNGELLAVERGSMALEKQRHAEFKEEHLALEWFKAGGRVSDHIKVLNLHEHFKRGGGLDEPLYKP